MILDFLQNSGSWAVSDLLTLLKIVGSAIVALIMWIVRLEIFLNRVNSKVDNNTSLDKERVQKIDTFMADLKSEIASIHQELKEINTYIISQKARESN